MLRSCHVKFRHNQAEHRLIIICANKYERDSGIPVKWKKRPKRLHLLILLIFFLKPILQIKFIASKEKNMFFNDLISIFSQNEIIQPCVPADARDFPQNVCIPINEWRCCLGMRFSCRGGAAALHLCHRSTVQPTRRKHLKIWEIWRWALQLFAAIWSCFEGRGGRGGAGTSLWPQRCFWCVNGGIH